MKSIIMLAAAAVSTSLLLPTVAEAATTQQATVAEQVEYGDLDLSTSDGQVQLQRRIDFTVRRVCYENGALDLQHRIAFRQCLKQAKLRR